MKFNIQRNIDISKSYRSQAIKGRFDLGDEHSKEKFDGEIPIEDMDWNVGLIYGNSGTGKTTIAKELFGDKYFTKYTYSGKCIMDDMPDDCDVNTITAMFNKVGFSSPPCWLRPYKVLSNGERMRVDLARCLLDNKDLIVFDEFTSVVDRTVAKVSSHCVQKAIRRHNKKFIAVSCHSDILDWLRPDWVFYTNDMSFKATRGLHQRPKLNLEIYRCGRRTWRLFRKYHYLNTEIATPAKCFVGLIEDKPVAFVSSMHFPHPKTKNLWRGHRVVVLPEYQGLGIGHQMQSYEAQHYIEKGYRFVMTLSHRSLATSARKDPRWICTRKPTRVVRHGESYTKARYKGHKRGVDDRLTMSFEYIGEK